MKIKLKTHLYIPDCQITPRSETCFLEWIGKYICGKKPDVIICAGDFADMESLSSYDKGKKSFEGRRYKHDIQAARDGMTTLLAPLRSMQSAQRSNKHKVYNPRMVLTLGNHEHRIDRAIEEEAILEDTISIADLGYESFGWEVHPYLQTVEIDGILYSHFFPRGPNGRVMQNKRGCPSARAQVCREMQSSTSGHLQGLDWCVYQTGSHRKYGLIAGSCYLDDFGYLTPQGEHYWRGIVMKHEVQDGSYDPMFVSLGFLCREYGTPAQVKKWGELK